MKQDLQDKLIEVINSIQTAAGKASDFALEQLPDIAQQYVLYGRAKSALISLTLLLIAGSMLKLAHWAHKNPWNNSQWSWDQGKKRSESNVLAIGAGCFFGALFVFLAVTTFDMLAWFAPKVWLLRELAMLVK